MWHCRMGTGSTNCNIKEVSTGHRLAWLHPHLARFTTGHIVHAVNFIARKPIKQFVCKHSAGTTQPFFCGLKNKHGGAGEIACV